MSMGGNVAVLDGKKSYVQSKETGQKTRIEHEGGQYAMHVWVPNLEKGVITEQEKFLKGNKFAKFSTEKEEQGFTRQQGRR